jgi:hypothetical protein
LIFIAKWVKIMVLRFPLLRKTGSSRLDHDCQRELPRGSGR